METVDDSTFKITMKRPVADFLNPLASNKQTVFPRELVDSGAIVRDLVAPPADARTVRPSSAVGSSTFALQRSSIGPTVWRGASG
jgi:hypothetical protein